MSSLPQFFLLNFKSCESYSIFFPHTSSFNGDRHGDFVKGG